ncbi:MAG TPA: SRPBCC family protein [Segetibacter sp.]|jgi:ligand-binding SRPBCC domain-containing protein
MSKTYHLRQIQKLPITLEEAWEFFSNPVNLATITPPSLDFKIISDITEKEIYEGQLITYKVRPLFGIALIWLSEITTVQKHRSFIDEQRKGPYKLWHHEHHFKAIDGGTEMIDIVEYQVPFGVLGTFALPVVKRQLHNIFTYRRNKIEELFRN